MLFASFTFCLLLQSLTPEVIEHAQAGAAAQKQGHFDVAIQEFRKVTELQPDSASAHANLGDAYFQNGDYVAAIPELEHALQLNPNLLGTQQALGVALLIRGDPEGALPHLEKTHVPELLGLAYLETGRLGSAIMALQVALERQPNDPDLLYYFGRATGLAAKRTSDKLKKIDPALTREKEAGASADHRPLQDVATLQTALAKQPNDPQLLFDLHRAATLASKQAFDKIVQIDAGSARAHQVAADRYVESGRLPDAEREYAESLRLKPYTSGVHLALGTTFESQGNWPAAAVEFRLESQLRPADADARYLLGAALLQQGQVKEGLAELTRADQLRPGTPQILLALGSAAYAAKDAERAEKSWVKLLAISPESKLAAQAHFLLATLYRDAGKLAEADREMAAYEKLKSLREY